MRPGFEHEPDLWSLKKMPASLARRTADVDEENQLLGLIDKSMPQSPSQIQMLVRPEPIVISIG